MICVKNWHFAPLYCISLKLCKFIRHALGLVQDWINCRFNIFPISSPARKFQRNVVCCSCRAATLSISVGQWRGECGWRQTPIPNFRPAPLPPKTPASYTKIFSQNSQWVATVSELKSNLQMFSTFLAMDDVAPIQSKLIPSTRPLMYIIYISKVLIVLWIYSFLWPLIYQ